MRFSRYTLLALFVSRSRSERRARVGDLPLAGPFRLNSSITWKAVLIRPSVRAGSQAKLIVKRYSPIGRLREARLDADAVGAAQILAQRPLQVASQRVGHRVRDHAVHLVVLERPAEHDADLAPGLDAALDLLLDDARRRTHADVLRRLVPVQRRQARRGSARRAASSSAGRSCRRRRT